MSIVIRGGSVVSSTGVSSADVVVEGETIEALLAPGSSLAASAAESAERVIDATGRYVVPGGVDVHTHLALEMSPEATVSDSFETGTVAAAWGGTTTVVDFCNQTLGDDVRRSVDEQFAKAEGQCVIDYAFHMSMGDVTDSALKEMPTLIDEGITSFKYYMAYPGHVYSDDGQILRAMQVAAETGAMVMVHAENGIAIDVLREQAVERGNTDPVWHGRTRPSELEGEATHRAISLAAVAGAPVYIVHLSATEALAEVAAARDRGRNVFAETCPQYLYLSIEDHLTQEGIDGLTYVCSPPLREHHHSGSLWTGLRADDLSVVSTDHCPFCEKDKLLGIDDFRLTPNGLGSIEHRMDLIHQGVVDGHLSIARWVETCSTTPARLFGMYPKKGVIAPGSDADVVIYDPSRRHTLGVESHHMNSDISAWQGFDLTGAVETVMSRGQMVIDNGKFVGRTGRGRFVKRGLSDLLI
ncbi:MAG: dihydropyrimidinase [Actinomycetota bacterium]|nr:dihydropyrimidinase [Actinomycetota bacterium]